MVENYNSSDELGNDEDLKQLALANGFSKSYVPTYFINNTTDYKNSIENIICQACGLRDVYCRCLS